MNNENGTGIGDDAITKIVVIGASAAGMKAACRARRLISRSEVIVIESGEYISYAACGLPYFLSGDIPSFDDLRRTAYGVIKDVDYFKETKDVHVRTHLSADSINRDAKTVHCTNTETNETEDISYDTLVIATGASPFVPNIPGRDLPGVCSFTKAEPAIELKNACQTGQIGSVALIGAGFIGIELCEAFAALWGIEVTLFEAQDYILSGILDAEVAHFVENMLAGEGIDVQTGICCTEIVQGEKGLIIKSKDGAYEKEFDRVVFGIGVRPNVRIAREAGLDVGPAGGISVDEFLRTKDPNIYAGGDCIELPHKLTGKPVLLALGSIANRTGRAIGENIAGRERRYSPVLGNSVLKAFDYNVACVGLSSKKAREAGYSVGETWGAFEDRAHYYPEPKTLILKLIFDTVTEKILGVQAAGPGNVVRRVDSTSALIQNDAVISDIIDFEQAYAPPFSGPIDPLHTLAYNADDILNDGIRINAPDSLRDIVNGKCVLLDVRLPEERELVPLKNGSSTIISIPLDELRGKIDLVPADKKILAICQRGPRSYEALRVLRENGMTDTSYLGGGMLFASIYTQ